MSFAILHVLLAQPDSVSRAQQALRAMRRALADDGRALLLFCDLPPSQAVRTPEDEPILRCLQSGVMAMEARAPGRCLLLVRRRAWDDAARAYLGSGQAIPVQQVIAHLLASGSAPVAFEAASFSPASLKGRFDTLLFSQDVCACTPDAPERMRNALSARCGCVRARARVRRLDGEPLLARLLAGPFSLSAVQTAYDAWLQRRGLATEGEGPTLYDAQTLFALYGGTPLPSRPCPLVEDALFVTQETPTLTALVAQMQSRFARTYAQARREAPTPEEDAQEPHLPAVRSAFSPLSLAAALLPLVQMALILLAALTGWAPLTFTAVILPELASAFMPRLLPGALVRTALLPLTAALSLNALFGALFARSRLLRLRLRGRAMTPEGCAICGALLIPAGFLSIHAAMPLLAIGLLWLGAPLLARALASPMRERIPLSQEERRQMTTLAEHAFYTAEQTPYPGRRMLCSCAGCMLGLLEADEAARRVAEALLHAQSLIASVRTTPEAPAPAVDAAELACALASAQFLREHMADCDAALRTLPAEIEALYLSLNVQEDGGLLCVLMQAAVSRQAPLSIMQRGEGGMALDALFLPRRLMRGLPPEPTLRPLMLPHTFLRAQLQAGGDKKSAASDEALRFLMLCGAALEQPFEKLLWRTPAAEPYAPLLSVL